MIRSMLRRMAAPGWRGSSTTGSRLHCVSVRWRQAALADGCMPTVEQMASGGSRENIEPVIAFVGVLATAESDVNDPAFNPAGQMFVEGLLRGLASAGLPADWYFSESLPCPRFRAGNNSFREPAGSPPLAGVR